MSIDVRMRKSMQVTGRAWVTSTFGPGEFFDGGAATVAPCSGSLTRRSEGELLGRIRHASRLVDAFSDVSWKHVSRGRCSSSMTAVAAAPDSTTVSTAQSLVAAFGHLRRGRPKPPRKVHVSASDHRSHAGDGALLRARAPRRRGAPCVTDAGMIIRRIFCKFESA